MKDHISMKISIYTSIGISVFSTLASAQDLNNPSYGPNLQQRMMMDRQEQNYQSTENMQIQRQRQQAWQAKENAIQAQIERYQSTSYYGSLITQGNTNILHWGGGGNTSKAASERNALSHCHEGQCRILLTVSNGCIGASRPESATDSLHWTLAVDKDPQKAIEKSYFACEKKYGVNQCIYASNPLKSSKSSATNHTDAFCSGYDYGAYTKK